LTDRELIEHCLKGNAKSQHRLFGQYAGKMMTVCRRYACDQKEAEDILQESFIKVFSSLDQYRFEGPLEGWIRRIVVHTALRTVQKKRIYYADIDDHPENVPALSVGPDAIANLSVEELVKLISHLPDGYRLVFNLYVLEGYDHKEIATILGITSATSRSQLLKARRLLQTWIENLQKIPKQYA
jgi:RNA polymerase sigma-70 factor (ECF subfamily)